MNEEEKAAMTAAVQKLFMDNAKAAYKASKQTVEVVYENDGYLQAVMTTGGIIVGALAGLASVSVSAVKEPFVKKVDGDAITVTR